MGPLDLVPKVRSIFLACGLWCHTRAVNRMAWGKTNVLTIVMTAGKHFAWPPSNSVTGGVVGSFEPGTIQFATVLFYHLCLSENAEYGWGTPDWQLVLAATEAVLPNVQTKD